MSKTAYEYCDELKLNMVAKRHNNGKWDCRITHPWFTQPILTSAGKDSFDECISELNERSPKAIEAMRRGIEKKNEAREKKHNEDSKYDDRDEWFESF